METKSNIRKEVFARRKEAADHEVFEKSNEIMRKLVSMDVFRDADCIFAYMDFNHEVMTKVFIETCWALGKRVAVPRTSGENMDFYEIHDFSTIRPGTFGVPEPQDTLVCEEERALLLIPGVAFDKNRNRVGYGKGFYDRYQELHPYHKTVAVAFDFQVFEQVPTNHFDVIPQYLITESAIYSDR